MSIEKEKLLDFIDKYNLGGNIEQIVLTIKNKKLKTDFIAPSGTSMVGFVEKKKVEMEDAIIGISNTKNLKNLLSIMDDIIIETSYGVNDDNETNEISFKDEHTEVKFVTGNPSIIPRAPETIDIPDADIEVVLDEHLIANFIKGKNALTDIRTFTVMPFKKKLKIIIGHSNILTNTVSFTADCTKFNKIEKLTFDAVLFKEILAANKGATKSKLEISKEGLMTVSFEGDDYKALYYLVCKDED